MCNSMNRLHFLICTLSGRLGTTAIKSLVLVQADEAQTDAFLHHTTSVSANRSVPQGFTRCGFVKSIDLLVHKAFLYGYLGLVDLKERAAGHTAAYRHAEELTNSIRFQLLNTIKGK